MSHTTLFAAGAAALLLLPNPAGAQTGAPASSIGDLQKIVKPGEVLIVVDDKGERTTGRLADLSSSTLTLQMPGQGSRSWLVSDKPVPPEQRQLPFDSVARIERRDSMKEGAWAGLAVGFGVAYFVGQQCDSEDFCGALAVLSLSSIIGGPVVGALIDHSITTPMYRAPGGRFTASLELAPAMARIGAGVSLKLGF